MFGGAFNFFGGQQQGGQRETPRGNTVVIDLEASLEQLYDGHSFEVRPVFDFSSHNFTLLYFRSSEPSQNTKPALERVNATAALKCGPISSAAAHFR